jgi:FixJ family two-component response regulator
VFASAEEFEAERVAVDCLILDVRLPVSVAPNCANGSAAARFQLPSSSSPGTAIRRLGHPPAIDTPSVMKPFDDVTLMAAIADAIAAADAPRERNAH